MDEPQDAVPAGVTAEQRIRVKALEAAAVSQPPQQWPGTVMLVRRAQRFEDYLRTGR